MPVYWRIDVDVYRMSTGRWSPLTQLPDFRDGNCFIADYHQQYLAKNPDGYCPDHSCGIPYKSPVAAATN